MKRLVITLLLSATLAAATAEDLFGLSGQSNMSGQGTNLQVKTGSGDRLFGNDYVIKALADPTDTNFNQVDVVSSDSSTIGSYVIPMANALDLVAQNHLMLIPCAHGGSSITDLQPAGPTAADHTNRATLYGSMVWRFRQAATNGTILANLMHIGETDGANAVSQLFFQTNLVTFVTNLFADTGVPTMICTLQQCNINTQGRLNVNSAITNSWGSNHILQGPDLRDLVANDGAQIHIVDDAQLLTAGNRWAARLTAEFYPASLRSVTVTTLRIGTAHWGQ